MKCSKCGAECSGNFCSNCGAKLDKVDTIKNETNILSEGNINSSPLNNVTDTKKDYSPTSKTKDYFNTIISIVILIISCVSLIVGFIYIEAVINNQVASLAICLGMFAVSISSFAIYLLFYYNSFDKKIWKQPWFILISISALLIIITVSDVTIEYINSFNNEISASNSYEPDNNSEDEDYYSNLDEDEEIEDETEKETEPKITYKKINLRKLLKSASYYNGSYIKTTIKVTKTNPSKGEYSYIVYDSNGYDKITVKFKDVFPKKKPIVKGGYLTVQGIFFSNEDEYDDEITLTITADKRNKTDKTLFKKLGSEKKPTVYEEGQYRVGTDMKPGDYIAYTFGGGYYCISSDANGDDIVANNNFDNQNYIHVNSGQYLELSDCWIRPVSEKSKVTYYNGYLEDGQYKVGDDIAPGTYKVTATGTGDYDGYFCITSDANGDNIISNDNFGGTRYITISYGQYLELSDCKIKVK